MLKRDIVLIVHNIRSSHNVGSLLRTAEGLGVSQVFLTGYSPYPRHKDDERLPHIADKITRQIQKTALGAEAMVKVTHKDNVIEVIGSLKDSGFKVAALEQTADSLAINKFVPVSKIAIVVGNEVDGLEAEIIGSCDLALAIPMFGKKESFNVAQAAAMALYHCRFAP